ncbi:MAG TPA: tRNA (guanosine(46)-N7)-methyltransferase TrmB [Porphyromonadaceae bacterium]|nr:tRNA (guanosine(46)-N7)-methyltransferase TrmB [Porphyromonadaceae bacterium]
MGKNKLQKFAMMEGYPHVFQCPYSVWREGEEFSLKGKWREEFFKNNHPIVLELGCGRGEYTTSLASLFPEKNYIGVDIKGARMWAGAKESLEKGLSNVAFLRTHIEWIDAFFAPQEVEEIWITFPDPQMKKERKRLTSPLFLEQYQRVLREGGVVHLKTDSHFLFTYTKALLEKNDILPLRKSEDISQDYPNDAVLSIPTAYEEQWRERGIAIKYISFSIPQGRKLESPQVEIAPDEYRSFNRSRRSVQPKKEE